MKAPAGLTLAEVCALTGAALRGDPHWRVLRISPLETAGPDDLAVFHHPRYHEAFALTRAGAVLVRETPGTWPAAGPRGASRAVQASPPEARASPALLVCADPYLAYAKVSRRLHPQAQAVPGCDAQAAIDPTAAVDPSAEVRAFAYVGPGAVVGAGTVLHPFSHVGAGARVGAGCTLHAGAVLTDGCSLGARVILHPNAVVGSDGFGYALDVSAAGGPCHLKIPQVGIARIEDDAEIGAGSCIDRAALGETVVGHGTKIDNLVQVAHNVTVGPLSLLCAQAGVAGSTSLGAGVVLAGQAGVTGHLRLGDGARVAAQSGVMADVPAGQTHGGSPAQPQAQWLRLVAAQRRLPDLLRELAQLRQRVEALERAEPLPAGNTGSTPAD